MNEITALTVPKWGMAMEEGTLIEWLINEGDEVAPGDGIAELESSKIVNVLESHIAGKLRRKVAAIDDTLPVGGLLAVLADDDVTDADIDAFIASYRIATTDKTPAAAISPAAETTVAKKEASPDSTSTIVVPENLKQGADDSAVPATAHARKFAASHGINLNHITGSGRGGRISVTDIEQAIITAGGSLESPAAVSRAVTSQDDNGVTDIPMSGIRQNIARRLQAAKRDIPHYRLYADARIDALLDYRKELNKATPETDISVNDLLIKACAMALQQVPECNVQFHGDHIRQFSNADIAVAVAIDEGLITPIITQANRKRVEQIAAEMTDLIRRARGGGLKQHEYEGGSFTLSNLGMFGVRQFDAIINPPQCAILAIGKGEPRAVVDNGNITVATVISMTLSLDHRVIDGATGARFLQTLTNIIETRVKSNQ